MPTEQKTSLGLNRWQGTDKPARSDFVADNETLDTLLTEHFGDTQALSLIHIYRLRQCNPQIQWPNRLPEGMEVQLP